MRRELTDRQRKFLEIYISGATNYVSSHAAEKAGFKWPEKAGSRLRNHPVIASIIDATLREDLARALREHAARV